MTFEPISKIAEQLHRRNFPQRADELSYPQAKIAPTPPSTWSANKQLALLTVGRFLPFASDCIAHMKSLGAKFDQPHLAELRINGLIYKRDVLDRVHKLTPGGKRYVNETTEIVARQLGLHHIRERNTGDGKHHQFVKTCTCGFRTLSGIFARRNQPSIDEQVALHIADPEAWKRPKPPSPATQAAFDRIENMGKVVAFEHPDKIDIDDCHNVYGDGQAWPQIDTPCEKSPTEQCEYNGLIDPDRCIHCERKT